jgi:XapX domain-containing protein
MMQAYAVSLVLGLLVGAFYAVMRVHSPAPPLVALAGLLGMVLGEQGMQMILHAFYARS